MYRHLPHSVKFRHHSPGPVDAFHLPCPFLFFFFLCSWTVLRSFSCEVVPMPPTVSASDSRVRFFACEDATVAFALRSVETSICIQSSDPSSLGIEEQASVSADIRVGSERTAR